MEEIRKCWKKIISRYPRTCRKCSMNGREIYVHYYEDCKHGDCESLPSLFPVTWSLCPVCFNNSFDIHAIGIPCFLANHKDNMIDNSFYLEVLKKLKPVRNSKSARSFLKNQ